MHHVVMLLQGRTPNNQIERRVDVAVASVHSSPSNHEFSLISSRCTCTAEMRNTNSTQQMSACGLLTNTGRRMEKPKVESDLAMNITLYPGIKHAW